VSRNLSHITDDILVKYLLQETTAEENAQVEQWKAQSEANQKHFDQFRHIWEESKKLAAKSTVDEHAAWECFQQRITTAETKETKTVDLKPRYGIIKIAAALLVLICGTWFTYNLANRNNEIALSTGNETLTDTLPDGSIITLNKYSELKYAMNDDGKTRDVTLKGEAFFNVAPDKSKPFIISVNDVTVQVVGTSFNVKNTTEQTEVIVETGVVEVAKHDNSVTLTRDEKATVAANSDELVKDDKTDDLYNYYRTKEFVCNNTPLWRLVDVLNEAYRVNIVITDPRLRNLPLTATFTDEPVENILAVVAETLHIKAEKKGTDILIR
jgi:ferric-dicitrate binding protein FerR (iron transport regulator)